MRICQSWQEAITVAGLDSPLLTQASAPLTSFAPFNAYQATDLTLEEYLAELALYVGVPESKAESIHNGILREPYPGIDEVIDDLIAAGYGSGCLSNTNAPHWHVMTETEPFAPVAKLAFRAGSHELGCAKPSLEAFRRYAARFGIEDARIVYFDDALANVEAANQLGWEAHLVDPWGDPAGHIRRVLLESYL